MRLRTAVLLVLVLVAQQVAAGECWTLTSLKGQIATSDEKYAFQPDKFSKPILLCFNDDGTGSVSGEDTRFVSFGRSTLIGWAQNKGIELVEAYQIDRTNGEVHFIKTRIGTATVLPGAPDVVSAFVGVAVRVRVSE